jgi:hypothetical protein
MYVCMCVCMYVCLQCVREWEGKQICLIALTSEMCSSVFDVKLFIFTRNTIFSFDPETSWHSTHLSIWRDYLDAMSVHHTGLISYQLSAKIHVAERYEFREVVSSPRRSWWVAHDRYRNNGSAGTRTITFCQWNTGFFFVAKQVENCLFSELIAAIYLLLVWNNNKKNYN